MERTKEEDDELYISCCKQKIDEHISANNYRLAFELLLAVMYRLDDGKQKKNFVKFYLDNFQSKSNNSHLNFI